MRKITTFLFAAIIGAGSLFLFQNCAEDVNMDQYNKSTNASEDGGGDGGGGSNGPMPTLTSAPYDLTILAGQSASFSAAFEGAATYAWFKNNVAVNNTTSTHVVAAAAVADAGVYMLRASNPNGSVEVEFTLTVQVPRNCTFNTTTVAHGTSITAYTQSTAREIAGERCIFFQETRTCNNGVLSGTAPFATCTFVPCTDRFGQRIECQIQ